MRGFDCRTPDSSNAPSCSGLQRLCASWSKVPASAPTPPRCRGIAPHSSTRPTRARGALAPPVILPQTLGSKRPVTWAQREFCRAKPLPLFKQSNGPPALPGAGLRLRLTLWRPSAGDSSAQGSALGPRNASDAPSPEGAALGVGPPDHCNAGPRVAPFQGAAGLGDPSTRGVAPG